MNRDPAVTVVMPVYNAEPHLREAIESILNQDFSDFELLTVNDGSSDGSLRILHSYDDSRIRILDLGRNQGVVAALNQGLSAARGRYIARMDADDISLPQRLRLQFEYMEAHRDIGVCGTWFRTVGRTDQVVKHPIHHTAILDDLLHVGCVLAHPTVMIRSSALGAARYEEDYRHAEDYRLWAILSQTTRFANIPEVCLVYREHPGQVSLQYARVQEHATQRIRAFLLCSVSNDLDPADQDLATDLMTGRGHSDASVVRRAGTLLARLARANLESRRFSHERYIALIAALWFRVCVGLAPNPIVGLTRFLLLTPHPLRRGSLKNYAYVARLWAVQFQNRLRRFRESLWVPRGIVVALSGDLACQMFQYATARSLASSRNLVVRLDLSDFSWFRRHSYALGGFRIVAYEASAGEMMRIRHSTKLIYRMLGATFPNYRLILESPWDGPTRIPVTKPSGSRLRLKGYWQDRGNFAGADNRLRNEFTPTKALDSARAAIASTLEGCESVAVYSGPARFVGTPDLCGADRWPLSAPPRYYGDAVRLVRERHPRARFFLFHAGEAPQSLTGMTAFDAIIPVNENSVEDLYLIAASRHFVIPPSLFAWWAAWLGRGTRKTVVCPSRWHYFGMRDDNKLIPSEWITIDAEQ